MPAPSSSLPSPASPAPAVPNPALPDTTPPAAGEGAVIDPFTEAAKLEAPQGSGQSTPQPLPNSPGESMPADEASVTLYENQPGIFKSAELPAEAGAVVFDPIDPAKGDVDGSAMELELLRLINAERTANNIESLGVEESMRFAARIRAPEVLGSLSHTRPDGSPYYTAMDEAGFVYAGKWHGENVSYMYFTSGMYTAQEAASKMFQGLKDSPGHYQNMLSEHFLQTGIGVYIQTKENMIQVGSAQLFAGR